MTQDISTFASLNLSEPLLKTLKERNYHTPSAIQVQTIPVLLKGKHVIGMAQTGTGKTAAFALPILHNLSDEKTSTQALILAPTRELAIQVADQFEMLSKHLKNVTVAVLCGGQDYGKQLKQLRGGAQIVVGTPGRILDHIDRKTLPLDQLSTFIIDEADEMLRMGFIEDVETILAKLPEQKQIALFSATMPSRIRHIAQNYLTDPVSVEIRAETATVKAIEQKFLFANGSQKSAALLRILAVEEFQGMIVFVRTKSSTEEVAQVLQQQGHRAMAIHGDITQTLRERIISQFRSGAIDVLVATDVAARGLDVERVTHVINYDVPFDCETYVHRIGRTGRAGRSGVTILFITPKESRLLSQIERHTRQSIEKIAIPNDHQIKTAKKNQFMANITTRLTNEHLGSYHEIIKDYLADNDVSAIDVAAALALMMNKDKSWHELSLPKHAVPSEKERGKSNARESRFQGSRESKFSRSDKGSSDRGSSDRERFTDSKDQELFRIDVGRVHGVKPGNIVGAIANEAGLKSKQISGLKINNDHSTVYLPKGMAKEIVKDLNKTWVCGRQLNVTLVSS